MFDFGSTSHSARPSMHLGLARGGPFGVGQALLGGVQGSCCLPHTSVGLGHLVGRVHGFADCVCALAMVLKAANVREISAVMADQHG